MAITETSSISDGSSNMERQNDQNVPDTDTIEELVRPDVMTLSDNERVERLTEWVELSEAKVGYEVIAYFDAWCENLQIVEGSIIQSVDKYFKDSIVKLNRKAKSIQKEYDLFMAINDEVKDPIDIPDITDPASEDKPDLPSDFTPPISGCVPNTTWIDPVTCEKWFCDENGLQRSMGLDQNCINNKIPPPFIPPVDPGGYGSCVLGWPNLPYDNKQQFNNTSTTICGGQLAINVMATAAWNDLLSAIAGIPKPMLWSDDANKYFPSPDHSFDPMPSETFPTQIVNIPLARNSLGNTSIYTDDGENLVREKFNDFLLSEKVRESRDKQEYGAKIIPPIYPNDFVLSRPELPLDLFDQYT